MSILNNKFSKILIISVFAAVLFFFVFSDRETATASLVGNADNATLTLTPQTAIAKVGGIFAVNIDVDTHGQNVVVVAAYLSYNPNIIEMVSVDVSGSAFSMIAENVIDPINGKVALTVGVPSPGVNTVNGRVATLNVRGKTDSAPSSDNLNFIFTAGLTTESNVILNDGNGTDILSGVYNSLLTFDGTPPANVSNFTATPGNNQIALAWTNPSADFNGVTIVRKTTSNPINPTDGTVVYDSSGTSYTNTGLTIGTTYYYTAFSRDVVLNYSSGVSISSAPTDTIPPATISNLSASATSARSITLSWTAVGDDASAGTASSYDIRYSTLTITSANWGSSTQASGEPTPKANGGSETMTIPGLNGGTTYYFAVKAIDDASNASVLSNIISFKTYNTADLSRDYLINSVDFGVLMSYWGSTARPAADANQDGLVNSVDFGIMMSQWGNY